MFTHSLILAVLVSLIRGDVADQLNLDGPTTSLDLFGIQVTSHLKN